MRSNFPLLSKELNDIFLTAYERNVNLLGYDDEDGVVLYSGQYDIIQSQCEYLNKNYVILNNETYPDTDGFSIPQQIESLIYRKTLIRGRQ